MSRTTSLPRIALSGLAILLSLFIFRGRVRNAFLRNLGLSLWAKVALVQVRPLGRESALQVAMKCFEKASPFYSAHKDSSLALALGDAYWISGNKERASQIWEQSGVRSDRFIKLGSVDVVQDTMDADKQVSYLEKAIAIDPERSDALYYQGIIFEKLGYKSRANRLYKSASKLDNWPNPRSGFDAHYQRGLLLFNRDDLESAQEAFERAIQFAFEANIQEGYQLATTHRRLGSIHQKMGNLAQARTEFERAMELKPDDYWNYLSLALVAAVEGNPEDVIEHYFDLAVTIGHDAIWPYVKAAQFYRGNNELDKASYYCNQTPERLRQHDEWQRVCQIKQ